MSSGRHQCKHLKQMIFELLRVYCEAFYHSPVVADILNVKQERGSEIRRCLSRGTPAHLGFSERETVPNWVSLDGIKMLALLSA